MVDGVGLGIADIEMEPVLEAFCIEVLAENELVAVLVGTADFEEVASFEEGVEVEGFVLELEGTEMGGDAAVEVLVDVLVEEVEAADDVGEEDGGEVLVVHGVARQVVGHEFLEVLGLVVVHAAPVFRAGEVGGVASDRHQLFLQLPVVLRHLQLHHPVLLRHNRLPHL